MHSWLDRRFKVSEKGSSLRVEVIGGITTFMAMSYIIAVQPAMMQKAGMDFGAVMVATCLSAAAATKRARASRSRGGPPGKSERTMSCKRCRS